MLILSIVSAILLLCITIALFRIADNLEAIYSVLKRTLPPDKK